MNPHSYLTADLAEDDLERMRRIMNDFFDLMKMVSKFCHGKKYMEGYIVMEQELGDMLFDPFHKALERADYTDALPISSVYANWLRSRSVDQTLAKAAENAEMKDIVGENTNAARSVL